MSEPKRHHYIPICHSKNFTAQNGFLYIVDKWNLNNKFECKPHKAFTAKYLYSQPNHAEAEYNNAIEHFFSDTVETNWTPVFRSIENNQPITIAQWEKIVPFISSMLVRVPLSLDATIEVLQQSVLNASNQASLPEIPKKLLSKYHRRKKRGNKETTINDSVNAKIIDSNIDPHCAITSMPLLARNIPIFQPNYSFGVPKVIRNQSNIPFILSDNPVCFYQPRKNIYLIKPYVISPNKNFQFIFPISSNLAIVNQGYNNNTESIQNITSPKEIIRINNIIARFAYRYISSTDEKLTLTVAKDHYNSCPRPFTKKSHCINGDVYKIYYRIGKPKPMKNVWSYDFKR